MSPRVVFATPNQGHQDDLRWLLADLEVVLSRVGPPVPDGLDLIATAQLRARSAFAAIGERVFVENTELELEGEGPWRGRQVKALLAELGEPGFCARFGGRAAASRVVVALCESASPDDEVRLFFGELWGQIAAAPRGPAGRGWDRVFVPDGYLRTFAELGGSSYLLNMRHAPYLDLADYLRGRTFGGAFEAHITVRCAPGARAAFAARCDELGVKHLDIELSSGEQTAQPMTASVHRGELRAVQAEVHDLARALVASGHEILRTKIEALPRNRDLPQTDEEAAAEPGRYFEYHLKVVVPPHTALDELRATAAALGAKLSRNARRQRADGSHERFVTLRVPGLGQPAADARFSQLERAVAALGLPITRRVREYTVYDSNLGLDRGWT